MILAPEIAALGTAALTSTPAMVFTANGTVIGTYAVVGGFGAYNTAEGIKYCLNNECTLEDYLMIGGNTFLAVYGSYQAGACYNSTANYLNSTPNMSIPSQGSTGRTQPQNLTEDIMMRSVKENPQIGKDIPVNMNDPKWPSSGGWVKMQYTNITQNGQRTTIHYVYNPQTEQYDDFKFSYP